MHVAIVSKQEKDSLPSFQCAEVSVLEKDATATRLGIDYFLKHYSETSMDFWGKLLLPSDREANVCCFASLEFAVHGEMYVFNLAWLVQCLDARVD